MANYKKILIVEDEKVLREMYAERFKKEHLSVTTISDAQEALQLLKTEKFDLILLDILLPGLSGIEMLEQLKKESPNFQANVLIFSNYDDAHTMQKAKELKTIAYLRKTDYTPSQIVKLVLKKIK